MLLPKLYKRTNTGAIQEWQVEVDGIEIVTTYGQVGGKLQTTTDQVKAGKNQGRKNETDQEEQAQKEANSQWLKKKKAGYVESLKDAESGKVDSVIEGGILPMLAKVYEDHSSKIAGERVAVQPKLDGGRMICVIDNLGEVTLWTRTRKRVTSMGHIELKIRQIAKSKNWKNLILDGEVYCHSLRSEFEKLMSAFRKEKTSEESRRLQYHVYDLVSDKCFEKRIEFLKDLPSIGGGLIHLVPTEFVDTESQVKFMLDRWIGYGYEGAMVRRLGIGYENKRSDQLLKLKTFSDAEFIITGVQEGRGKLQGHAGNFLCKTKSGKEFGVKLSGETGRLKKIFDNSSDYIGQMLTVKYQGLTGDGIPRFPVGLRIREDL